jgi:hypothetical protein
MKTGVALLITFIIVILFGSCHKEKTGPGKINLKFAEIVDGQPLKADTLMYMNEAGNNYLVTEVQYFISKPVIYYIDGTSYTIKDSQGIHYTDNDIAGSHNWNIPDDIPAGIVDSIVFIFGLDEETNKTGLFLNPPESNMFWPDALGGGYHYMKLNGKWLDTNNMLSPFNFHLGIGQTYDTTGQVTGFVQNYFKVVFNLTYYSYPYLEIKPDQPAEVVITMNIESWFKTPHTWDFNEMPGMMMMNQDAIRKACENGDDVFTFNVINGK